MDKFVSSIKKKYQERLINRQQQWPPCKSNRLVRLELMKGHNKIGEKELVKGQIDIQKKDKTVMRTPIKYGDLFKRSSEKNNQKGFGRW